MGMAGSDINLFSTLSSNSILFSTSAAILFVEFFLVYSIGKESEHLR